MWFFGHVTRRFTDERIITMKCFQCPKGKMASKAALVEGEIRGEKFTVETEATVCARCGFQVFTDEQAASYNIAISDAYRRDHGLLTSADLRSIRERLQLSLRNFAKFVGVGVASVKRWEAGAIQDEANDRLIRLRTDIHCARENVRDLESRLQLLAGAGRTAEGELPEPGSRHKWDGEVSSDSGVRVAAGVLSGTCYGA